MSLRSRPLWFEGQLVRPQHLQQLVRWVDSGLEQRVAAAAPFSWGVDTLVLDQELLTLGKIGLQRCRAVLPDGTLVDLPSRELPPPVLVVGSDGVGQVIVLAVPARNADAPDAAGESARYRRQTVTARDTGGLAAAAELEIGQPTLRLLPAAAVTDDLVCLPLLRIRAVTASGALVPDDDFIPPSLRMGSHPRFAAVTREAVGMLRARGDTLADHLDPARAGNALGSMVDFALLQLLNGAEPVLLSIAGADDAPPVVLYWELLRLAGALATFSRRRRRPGVLPDWRHEEPGPVLTVLLQVIRDILGSLSVEAAVALPLEARGQGIWVSAIADRSLLSAMLVLAVSAAMDPERVRGLIPTRAKIGPAESILDLVNLQLPGVGLRPMPVVPTEIPYRTGTVYFELDRTGELWRAVQTSPALVLHIGTDLPELRLEFWAIRRS